MELKQHWDNVYETKTDLEVGWFQENPEISLQLVQKYSPNKDQPIIDIGGGNSHLLHLLFNLGFTNLSVLDVSKNAIERSKNRFGNDKEMVKWIESNILDFSTTQQFQTWHDRAVFHFLINKDDIKNYKKIAANSIISGGHLIIGTFSLTGPKMCSGLPITQYSEESLCENFQDKFNFIESFDDVHITPSGNPQNFIWVVFQRK